MLEVKPATIPDVPSMSLTQMRDRLSAMIAENERRGWPERNACPMAVKIVDRPEPGKLREHTRYYLINHASNALVGLPEGDTITLEACTSGQLGASHVGRRRKRA